MKYIMKGAKKLYLNENDVVVKVETINDGETIVDQQWIDQCDANSIIAKYNTTGQFNHSNPNPGIYADISQVPDFNGTMNRIVQAQESFDSLPAQLRARFANSPAQLLSFLENPENQEEGIKLGLLTPKQTQQAQTKTNEPNEQKQHSPNAKTKKEDPKPSSQNSSES